METLYSNVLERIEEEDRKWVQWILKWVIANAETIGVEQLREAVEWSLQDKLPEFQHFLEVECGSLVHVIPSSSVELIHETLRSFLMNPGQSKEFHIDEKSNRGCILENCISILSSGIASTNLCSYVSGRLFGLFISKRIDTPLFLTSIYRFFEGGGCKEWMKYFHGFDCLVERQFIDTEISVFYEYINEEIVSSELDSCQSGAESDKPLVEACTRRAEIRTCPWKLSQYLGRAAGERWLYGDLTLLLNV